MPVDTSIYGNVQRPRPVDPLAIQQQVLTLRSLQDQAQLNQLNQQLRNVQLQEGRLGVSKAQRDFDEEAAVRDLYSGAVNPDGTVNRQAVIAGAASRNLGNRVPGILKGFQDLDKEAALTRSSEATAAKTLLETNIKRVEARGAALGSLISAPDLSHQKVIDTLARLVQDGVITREQGWNATRALPGRPEMLRDYLIRQNLEVTGAADRLKAQLPQYSMQDTGKQLVPQDLNPLTNPNPATLQKTTTPGDDLSASVSRENSKRTDLRERELASQAVTYQTTGDNTFVALPNKAAPGTVVRAQAVLAPGGMVPLEGKMSEAQSKAIMEINQQRAIVSGGIQAAINNPTAFNFGRGLANKVPMGESIVGRGDTDSEAQARAYVFNNVSKVILERSGTASTGQEAARVRAFMPDDTDTAKQVENKFKGFLAYLDDLEAGARKKRSDTTPPAPPAPKPAFEIAPDVAEILKLNGVTK